MTWCCFSMEFPIVMLRNFQLVKYLLNITNYLNDKGDGHKIFQLRQISNQYIYTKNYSFYPIGESFSNRHVSSRTNKNRCYDHHELVICNVNYLRIFDFQVFSRLLIYKCFFPWDLGAIIFSNSSFVPIASSRFSGFKCFSINSLHGFLT